MDNTESSDNKIIFLMIGIVIVLLGLAVWVGSCLGESIVKKPYEATKAQLADSNTKLESLQSELTQAQSASATLQKDNVAHQTQLKSVQSDLTQAQNTSASLQKDNTELQAHLESTQSDLVKAQYASASLESDNAALQAQLKSVQSDLTQAQLKIVSLQQDYNSLRTQLASAQNDLSQAKSQSSSLQNSVATLQMQLATTQSQLSQAQAIQNTLQQNNTNLQSQLAMWYAWARSLPPTPSSITTGAPSLTLSPTSGPAGIAVTVTGSGFAVNANGNVFLDINHNSILDAGEPGQSVTTSSVGVFSIILTVPSAAVGTYQAMVSIPAGSQAQPLGIFNVTTNSTSVSPTSGFPGTIITITGSGFAENTNGNVFLDINQNSIFDAGEPNQSITTSPSGTFSVSLTAPPGAIGTYQVLVSIPAGTQSQLLGTFNITTNGPNIIVNPATGPAGSLITVTGNGFTANATGTVFLDLNRNGAYDAGEPNQSLTTSVGGAFSITLTAPSVPAGTYQVMVSIPASSRYQPLGFFNIPAQ